MPQSSTRIPTQLPRRQSGAGSSNGQADADPQGVICPLCLRERDIGDVLVNNTCADAVDCHAAARKARDRLAEWIESEVRGAQVYRATGLVVT